MIKTRPKYSTDLYGTIFTSSIKKIPGCMTYVVHPEIGKPNNLEVFESK
jgi:quinol monooxygenase YgiN